MAETFDTTRADFRGMVGVYHGEEEFAEALEANLRRGSLLNGPRCNPARMRA